MLAVEPEFIAPWVQLCSRPPRAAYPDTFPLQGILCSLSLAQVFALQPLDMAPGSLYRRQGVSRSLTGMQRQIASAQ